MPHRNPFSVRRTAFHEAGHAVAAVLRNIPFSRVWLLRRTDADIFDDQTKLGGVDRVVALDPLTLAGKLEEAKNEAILAFAGPVAECMSYPGKVSIDFELNKNDEVDARRCLRFATTKYVMVGGEANFEADGPRTATLVQQLMNDCYRASVMLVNENQGPITKVAEALLKEWELTEAQVAETCGK